MVFVETELMRLSKWKYHFISSPRGLNNASRPSIMYDFGGKPLGGICLGISTDEHINIEDVIVIFSYKLRNASAWAWPGLLYFHTTFVCHCILQHVKNSTVKLKFLNPCYKTSMYYDKNIKAMNVDEPREVNQDKGV